MHAIPAPRTLVALLALCSCAAHTAAHGDPAPAPTAGSNAAETNTASSPAAPAEPTASPAPSPNRRLVDELTRAIRRSDYTTATAIIDRARRATPPAQPSAETLAYYDATLHAYQGDFRGAARILHDHAAQVGPTVQAAFAFHDAMIALRTASGDLLGALVETDEMVRAGLLGTWSPDDRLTTVQLKQHWHRAYLLRMIAQTLSGAERLAFLDYAEHARQDYLALAGPIPDLHDSIAVLDAYFAYCANDRAAMLAAARQVNVAGDDAEEDLYLVQLAFDGAGDHAAAAAIRSRMASFPFITVLSPVFHAWMRADAATTGPHAFSPAHPTGQRPAP